MECMQLAKDHAAPEHDTDTMDEAAVTAAINDMRNGEEVKTEAEPEPEVIDVPETQEVEVEEHDEPTKPDDGEEKQKSEFVPHKTFHFTNEKRKAAEKERDEIKERYTRLEARTQALLEAQNGGKAEPATEAAKPYEPNPDDPIANINWIVEREQQRIAADKQTAQEREYRQQVEAVVNEASQEFNSAASTDTELRPMYEGVVKSFLAELEAQGVPPHLIDSEARKLEEQHILYARQNKIPLPQYMKAIAKARNITITPPQPAEQQPNREADGKFKAAQNRAKAQEAGASLGSSGGAVANMGGITPAILASMSDSEFKEYMDKNGGSLRKAYGVS